VVVAVSPAPIDACEAALGQAEEELTQLRALFRKYVAHVGYSEGTDFLTPAYWSAEIRLTESDIAAIKTIAYDEETST
jgi:hypothetical protein